MAWVRPGLCQFPLHYISHYFRVIPQLQFFEYARTVGTNRLGAQGKLIADFLWHLTGCDQEHDLVFAIGKRLMQIALG